MPQKKVRGMADRGDNKESRVQHMRQGLFDEMIGV
jgi:hypothetical protein